PTLVKVLVSDSASGSVFTACTRFEGCSWLPRVYEGRRRLSAVSQARLPALSAVSGYVRQLGAHGRELCHLCGKAGSVALEHQQPYLVEHRFHRLGRERLAPGEHDLLGLGRARLLVAVEQLLVQ